MTRKLTSRPSEILRHRPQAESFRGSPRLAGLYAIGATEEMLAPAPPALRCGTLANAVECAFSRAKSGDILLLSPACASYGQYTNFEERGKQFVQLVLARQTLNHC